MKFVQKACGMILLLTAIIVVVLFVFLLVESHEYYMINNVSVEKDDEGLDQIMCASVGAILVLILMILINTKSESRNPKAVKKKFDPLAAKKYFLSCIGHHTGFLILLRIISERIVRAVVIELLPLDLSEAGYIAGYYGIFRYFFSIILVVLLISDVISATILSSLKVATLVPDEIIHHEEDD